MSRKVDYKQTLITIFLASAILFAGIFAVMSSTLLQSVPCLLIGLACIVSALFEKRAVKLDYVFFLWLVSLIYYVVRAWLSPAKDLGTSDLLLILSVNGVFYLNTYVLVKKSSQYLLLVSILLLGIFNALNFIPNVNQFRDSIIPFASGDHQSGMYSHRNFCGNMMMMVSLLLTCFVLWGKMIQALKVVSILIVLGMCVALVMCSARGAYLGLISGMLVIVGGRIFTANMARLRISAFVGMIVAVIIGCVILWFGGMKLLDNRDTDISESSELAGRTKYFGMAIDQIPDAPLFGSGSMSYSYKNYEYWGDHFLGSLDHVWVHNEFLQALTDYGLVGFLLLLGCLVCAWYTFSYRQYFSKNEMDDTPNNRKAFQWGGLAMTVGFSVNSFVSFPAHCLPNIIVFALALSWLVKPIRGADSLVGRFTHKGVLVFIASMTFLVSYKEIKALLVFSKQGIYVDNANWIPEEHRGDGWFEALEEVVKVAPSDIRYERLASLLLLKSAEEGNLKIKNDMLERVLKFSDLALSRNPFNVVSIFNKAQCLHNMGRFEAANVWFTRFVETTKNRQVYFHPYEHKAVNLVALADSLSVQGDIDKAKAFYEEAYKTYYTSSYRRDQHSLGAVTFIVTRKINFLMKNDLNEDLDATVDEFYNHDYRKYTNSFKRLDLLHPHGQVMAHYADRKFSKRQPELAYKWYLKALTCYSMMKKTSLTEQMNEEKLLIENKINFLKSAKIKPMK